MKYAIVGDPVKHSRSPAIHTAGFRIRNIEASFDFIPTPVDDFDVVEAMLRTGDLAGVSVTMPHKTHAYEAVDVRSGLADRTHAVNTIIAADGVLTGTNTDVAGVRFAITTAGALSGPALVLGAGGAAAAALVALDGRRLFVSSREQDAAQRVLSRTGVKGVVVPWAEGVAGAVVVNATPIGMHGEELPPGPLAVASAVIDMAYGPAETPAIAYAADHGLRHADGIDMLVGQALEAFTLFTGEEAPVEAFYEAARGSSSS
jgi:shikimate dehydrogenase